MKVHQNPICTSCIQRNLKLDTYTTYICMNCTVNMELTVSEKSVFPTSFDRGRFQGNLFLFQKHKWLQKIFI